MQAFWTYKRVPLQKSVDHLSRIAAPVWGCVQLRPHLQQRRESYWRKTALTLQEYCLESTGWTPVAHPGGPHEFVVMIVMLPQNLPNLARATYYLHQFTKEADMGEVVIAYPGVLEALYELLALSGFPTPIKAFHYDEGPPASAVDKYDRTGRSSGRRS